MRNEQEWRRLGELLRHQRVVNLHERSRAAFARTLGLSSARVLNDLENGARDNYERDTLLAIEGWYRLPSSALREVLGDLYPNTGALVAIAHVGSDDDTAALDELMAKVQEIEAAIVALRTRISER
jgi:hypothetical protein